MRRELVIPLELAGLGFERQDRIGVEIVAFALAAVEIGTGIADRPEHGVERRVVGAGHPGRAGAMLDVFALPGFRAGLAGQRHGPESPDFLAGGLIERGDEAANTFVATRRSRDHQVADGERRGCPVVVEVPIRHFGFPQQLAIGPAERDHVGVVGEHEHAIAGHRDTAIESAGGVPGDAASPFTPVAPDNAARAGVERPAFVRARHVHHAVHDQGRVFDGGRTGHGENPRGARRATLDLSICVSLL